MRKKKGKRKPTEPTESIRKFALVVDVSPETHPSCTRSLSAETMVLGFQGNTGGVVSSRLGAYVLREEEVIDGPFFLLPDVAISRK